MTGKNNKPTLILWIFFGTFTGLSLLGGGNIIGAIIIFVTVLLALLELLGVLHKIYNIKLW